MIRLADALYLLIFILHLMIVLGLIGRGNRLGTAKGDRSHDRHYRASGLLFAYLMVFGSQAYGFVHAWGQEPNHAMLWTGSIVFFLGLGLRLWSVRTLGNFFTMEIGIRDGQSIIQIGPYARVRHPSYTGYLLILAGMGLAYESALAFAVPLTGAALFFRARMRDEEKMLLAHFGETYGQYMQRTKRLLPFIY
ncbi:MAG: isoprenylcysteine carboxylmethyltransferase family protein [Bdellovibrionales bacterium]|nr:isoprenylcysteine carboxylmethyltransferase family protein [Bdellovibrionales bacterium]